MMITPNFSEANKPIVVGPHQARITKYGLKTSKNEQKYIEWTFEIVGGDSDGSSMRYNTMTEGKGAGILYKFLSIAIPNYDGEEFDPNHLIGTRMTIIVAPEEYNGQTTMKIKSIEEPVEQSNRSF